MFDLHPFRGDGFVFRPGIRAIDRLVGQPGSGQFVLDDGQDRLTQKVLPGQTIAVLRLEAVPWARFCIDCQELAEKGMLEAEAG